MDLNEPKLLQKILGTDKRNPIFSIYADDEAGILSVYYGVQLLEKVANDREHISYKLLVGRLYNAGVKQTSLQKAFKVDLKTMKKWGDGLKTTDSMGLWYGKKQK